jgi:tight adherence protein B
MSSFWIRPLILVCIFAAVVLGAEVLVRLWVKLHSEKKGINQRLTMIERGDTASDRISLLRRSMSSIPPGLPGPIDRVARKIERQVLQAQLNVRTSTVLLLLIIAPIAIFVTLIVLTSAAWHLQFSFGRIALIALFSLGLGTSLPLIILNVRASRMRKRVYEQFPVALDVFVRGLRAGHPVASALELLTVEMPDPIGSQFGYVVDEITYGAELRDALQNMAERWDSDDMRMFVVSLSIQSETGGNLAEILENLSQVIREREAMLLKVRALSSEGRLTANMLTILPLGSFLVLFFVNPRFFLDVANDPWFIPGFTILLCLYLIGYFSIRRMVDLKV